MNTRQAKKIFRNYYRKTKGVNRYKSVYPIKLIVKMSLVLHKYTKRYVRYMVNNKP